MFLLGLLAEADSEAVRGAVTAELDTVLAVVPQADEDESLRLALIFLAIPALLRHPRAPPTATPPA